MPVQAAIRTDLFYRQDDKSEGLIFMSFRTCRGIW